MTVKRGQKPDVTPRMYYAWNPAGEKHKDTIRLTVARKERYERMGWRFKGVHA
jgi:hypothetical protein